MTACMQLHQTARAQCTVAMEQVIWRAGIDVKKPDMPVKQEQMAASSKGS